MKENKLTYLKYIQKENSNQIYEPEIICDRCGNQEFGDSPAIHVQHCFLCEELVDSKKGEKNDSRNNRIFNIHNIFLGNV
jgi:late competence protein required for DNA uptake (superfamily II DNA/RNA helicase)